jgi:hypothetical protein
MPAGDIACRHLVYTDPVQSLSAVTLVQDDSVCHTCQICIQCRRKCGVLTMCAAAAAAAGDTTKLRAARPTNISTACHGAFKQVVDTHA